MQRSWILLLLLASCRAESDDSEASFDELSGDTWESAGQTGGEVGAPGGGGPTGNSSGNCDEEPSAIDDPEQETELGFSVADITAFATGTKQAPLLWNEPMAFTFSGEVPVMVTPESGTTQITMEIAPAPGGARYIRSTPAQSSGSGGNLLGNIAGNCSDRVEIDVEVTLTTDGGAFDESFPATLHAPTPFEATMSWPFELDELAGALEVSLPGVDDAELKQFSVDTQLGPGDRFAGAIGGTVQQNNGQVASAGRIDLASWGDNPCESYGIPVSVDATIDGFSPMDVLAPINDAGPHNMLWADGSRSELTITATSNRAYACLQKLENTRLLLVSTAHASSSDARMDTELEVDVVGILGEHNQLTGTSLIFNSYMGKGVPAAEFENAFGVKGVDLRDSEIVTISFDTFYDVAGSEAPSGRLEVIGIVPFDCSTVPPPEDENVIPGCPGPTITTLESASW